MFDSNVCDAIGHYVYALRDPRCGQGIFYVGKGVRNRCFDHVEEARTNDRNTEKLETIREILNEQLDVKIDIVRHGLDELAAFEVEAALIDVLGLVGVGNRVIGHHGERGLESSRDIEIRYGAKPLESDEPLLLIKINQLYKRGMSADKVYDAVRWCWKLDINKAKKVKCVLAVANRTVRGVFEPTSFERVSKEQAKADGNPNFAGRIYFNGVAIDSEYLNTPVGGLNVMGQANPIRYLNVRQ